MLLRLAGLAGAVGFLVLIVAEHGLRPDVRPLEEPISDYGVGSFHGVFIAALVLLAASKLAVAWLLSGRAGTVASRVGLALLVVDAVATLVVAAAPTDVDGARTATGRLHMAAASVAFVGGVAAFALLALPGGPATSAVLRIEAGACVGLLVLLGAAVSTGRFDGLAERGLVAAIGVWLATASWIAGPN